MNISQGGIREGVDLSPWFGIEGRQRPYWAQCLAQEEPGRAGHRARAARPRCTATTNAGNRCKQTTAPRVDVCQVHRRAA
jgi:hypothetical protein